MDSNYYGEGIGREVTMRILGVKGKSQKIAAWLLGLFFVFVGVSFIGNLWIIATTRNLVHDSISDTPSNSVGIVLGTSDRTSSGELNLLFSARMRSTAQLFFARKIKSILLSGDGTDRYYNEPMMMKKRLISLGVPDSVMIIDSFGLRTFGSMMRAREVFKVRRATMITNDFHSFRALFIGRQFEMDVVSYCDERSSGVRRYKQSIREYFARTLCLIDLFFVNTESVYLGDMHAVSSIAS